VTLVSLAFAFLRIEQTQAKNKVHGRIPRGVGVNGSGG